MFPTNIPGRLAAPTTGGCASAHVTRYFEDDFLDVFIPRFNVVVGIALEQELTRGVVESEFAEFVNQKPAVCTAGTANLDVVEGLFCANTPDAEDQKVCQREEPFHS
jgi:hypothetical protein